MTDRTLASKADLDALRWNEAGLVPVVAQDAADGTVLMVAWADRDALARTLESGEMHFWSRSRRALWRKGESSGHTLTVRSLHADCDGDTVLARVTPAGPACHTGERTCFGRGSEVGGRTSRDVLDDLAEVIRQRDRERPEGSYTTRLLADENLRLKKIGEESAELILALSRGPGGLAAEEAADLVFHLMVALHASGHSLDDVRAVLAARRV